MSNSKRADNPEKGKRLKEYLKRAKVTQCRLEELSGIEPKSISPIVKGKNNLTLKTARKIITALNDLTGYSEYRLEYLLCEDDIPTETELRLIREYAAARDRSEALFNVMVSRFPDLLNVDITDGIYIKNDRLEVRFLPRSEFEKISEDILDYAKYLLCERAYHKAEIVPDEKAIEVIRTSRERNANIFPLAVQDEASFLNAHLRKRQWANIDVTGIEEKTRPREQ